MKRDAGLAVVPLKKGTSSYFFICLPFAVVARLRLYEGYRCSAIFQQRISIYEMSRVFIGAPIALSMH